VTTNFWTSATTFLGSAPYCYANSLAMAMGADAPPPSAIEVLTGSPFGAQFEKNGLPYFDPIGWNPDLGLDHAIALLGWECERADGGEPSEALDRLRRVSELGPVVIGPVDLGLLGHQPWAAGEATGVDHWMVVLGVDSKGVLFHDPDGFPYATLPVGEFLAAWRAERVECAGPFTMRSEFRRVRNVGLTEALRGALPAAGTWLAGRDDGGADGRAALERLAEMVEDDGGLDERTRAHLTHFAVRVGARRLADASLWLREIGESRAASLADRQARLLGSVQYGLVTGDAGSVAATLRQMAAVYGELSAALPPG
jgi:hypothetical protein